MKSLFSLLFALFFLPGQALGQPSPTPRYAVATRPAPVFSDSDLKAIFGGADGTTLRLDTCGQLRSLEFVAPPGTVFAVEAVAATKPFTIYRVSTREYPYPSTRGYFVDARFVETRDLPPKAPPKHLPDREEIIASLLAAQGTRYVWGGNYRDGLPELLTLYPSRTGSTMDSEILARWQLRGVDCSGLLYEATAGWTPRNTSALVTFGSPVPIAGLGIRAIVNRLLPLDLIVWKGHVIIVIDRERVIESRLECGKRTGVVVTPLRLRLEELMGRRTPVDDYRDPVPAGREKFVIRRWYEGKRRGEQENSVGKTPGGASKLQ